MPSVFDAAVYILEKCGGMRSMRLQRLCFYSQVWSLVWNDAPLFQEDFDAWVTGPVCPVLYYMSPLKDELSPSDYPGTSSSLSDRQKKTVDHVLRDYSGLDSETLDQTTKNPGSPWRIARDTLPYWNYPAPVRIPKDDLAMYYGGLEF